jgi:hypothetical protein
MGRCSLYDPKTHPKKKTYLKKQGAAGITTAAPYIAG